MTAVVTLPAQRPAPDDAAAEAWTLVERAQAGDAEAFAEIYRRNHAAVFRFILFKVGNRELAADLAADTFVRAWRRIGSVQWQGRDIGAWINTIARNLVADHFKSGRYRLEMTTEDPAGEYTEDPDPQPDAVMMRTEVAAILAAGMHQISAEQREVLRLRFLCGLDVLETAEAMGKNEGAVKALQFRAVRAMARVPAVVALLEAHRG